MSTADGERTADLQTLFDDLGIGSEEQGDPTLPSLESSGWLSYRLKAARSTLPTVPVGRPCWVTPSPKGLCQHFPLYQLPRSGRH